MAQSFVKNVIQQEKRYIGSDLIYDGPSLNIDKPNPFVFEVAISSEIPIPERSVVNLNVIGEPGADPDGTTYSGQFRIKTNQSTSLPSIRIRGSTINTDQANIIRNSMSVNETPGEGGLNNITSISLNLTQIANAGAKNFDIIIPYEDVSISTVERRDTIPFLSFDASGASNTFVNPISVNVDNNQLIIDAGNVARSVPALKIERNWGTRNIQSCIVYYDPNTSNNINFSISEIITGRELISIAPVNIPTIVDSTGTPTDTNYQVSLKHKLWRANASSGGYIDTSSARRMSYSATYGIGKRVNNEIVPSRLFRFGINNTLSGTASYSCTGDITPVLGGNKNLSYSINIDAYNTVRTPLYIFNRTSSVLNSVAISIDRTNNQNNYFEINGYINGILKIFRYSGFSNDMYVVNFLTEINTRLQNENPSWVYNSSRNTGIHFVLSDNFNFAKLGDMVPTSYSNVSTEDSLLFNVNPIINGVTNISRTISLYNEQNNISLSLQDFENWIKSNFGSFGLTFSWDEDVQGIKDLPAFPTIAKLGTSGTENQQSAAGLFINVFSVIDGLLNYSNDSTSYDASLIASSNNSVIFDINDSRYNTVEEVSNFVSQQLNLKLNRFFVRTIEGPSSLTLSSSVTNNSYKNILSSYLDFYNSSATINSPNSYTAPDTLVYTKHVIPGGSQDYRKLIGIGSISYNLTSQVNSNQNLGDLVSQINSDSNLYTFVSASLNDNNYSSIRNTELYPINFWDISQRGTLNVSADVPFNYVKRYDLNQYSSLDNLVIAIENEWSSNIDIRISSSTDLRADAIPANLISPQFIPDIKSGELPKILNGSVISINSPLNPDSEVTLRYEIDFASNISNPGSGNSPFNYGVQIAIGGYEKGGVFYPYEAPNTFFEPAYNSLFPIEFTTIEADVVYLLVKTRKTRRSNGDSVYFSDSRYSGIVKYSNGYNDYNVSPFVPTDFKYTSVWEEEDIGVPTVIPVPIHSTTMQVNIEDLTFFESVSLEITNKPSSIDQFGFLAINRTNNNKSQKESKISRSFGLVLDNRGSWDILISPEARLKLNPSGSIYHLGSFYQREVFQDDEGFDFYIQGELPSEVKNAISLSPSLNNPQVWILKVDYGVKSYLGKLVSSNADNCSVSIDILVRGRKTGVEGTAKVVIYYDYNCVYDIGICDYFWNLIDPPKVAGPEIIQNNIKINYETLVDCNNLTTPINYNVAVNAPLMLNISNIPTFKNGNSLLLIKSSYTPEIQGFYYPVGNEIDFIQFADCSPINLNLPLLQRLNKEFLILPNRSTPVNDIFEIKSLLQTENSYLYVKPQFKFPQDDIIKDCNQNEIVLVGIGYSFKNWENGFREDNVIIGLNLLFPEGLYTSPQIDFCYRYYYNQKKT